jgi:hypothetical protein
MPHSDASARDGQYKRIGTTVVLQFLGEQPARLGTIEEV